MELIGNKGVRKQLMLMAAACRQSDRPLPHMLLSGAAGCGKTSTAKSLAINSNAQFLSVTPESIKTRDDVLRIIDQFDKKTGYDRKGTRIRSIPIAYPILFIDEVHRIPITGQEHLGIVMEEWALPIDPKKAVRHPTAVLEKETINTRWCPRFTLVGATTNDGLLSKPFKDRFKVRFVFSTYTFEESMSIAQTHNDSLNKKNDMHIKLGEDASKEIALRGRGVPRIIVTLLERCRDMSIAHNMDEISVESARVTFDMLNIDKNGLNEVDVKILKILNDSENPLGVENLSVLTNESKQAITETVEPYLIQQELIVRTGRGRIITDKGRSYLILNGHIEDKGGWVDIPYNYVRSL